MENMIKLSEKESFLIVENLEAQEAPESNNAVMLFNSSVSPATLKGFFEIVSTLLIYISAVITVSFELEILELLQAVEDMYGALDEIYMIKCVFGTDILSCLSLSIC